MIALAVAGVVAATSVLLFVFGVNLLYLTWRALTLRPTPPPEPVAAGDAPHVCVQIPVYDERYVAERVLDSVCAMDWPRARLEVQVLDDSDDDTTRIVARAVARWRGKGVRVRHIRRHTRDGFKAGALAHAMTETDAPLIAIFDADFVPPADFLSRTVGAFADPAVGFVQARWGHLDEGYSLFTRLQAMAIDFHFLVEQATRSAAGYFTNFTGTAGVWRRAAIEDAGGWSAETLTEDLDLSYRAQLRGWKARYVEDLVVPEELPVSIDAYRRQQSRWATGSFQSAFRLLGPVLRSRLRAGAKFQAAIHLLAYGVGPVMLLQLACYPLLLLLSGSQPRLPWFVADAAAISILVGLTPWVGFVAAQTRRGRPWWSGLPAMLCQVVGAGMSLNTLIALGRATRPGGVFVRTPKHRIVHAGQEWRNQEYVQVGDARAALEGTVGLAVLALVPIAVLARQPLIAAYSAMFGFGFLAVASLSLIDLLEVLTLRRLGRRALARLRAAAPVIALFAMVAALLVTSAQLAEPFEDGYGHWLVAANLAATGRLHDPLFGMEDTWLPAYHFLAAAVLVLTGLWNLAALKLLSAAAALATAGCVYALAANRRQARLAVVLLVLNPVFLFTSGSAVVEPVLTSLLTAAGLAAVRGRMKVAALLALLACATSTKAWIWVMAAVGLGAIEVLRSRARRGDRRAGAIAWAVPAVAMLLFLQLGFAPATHSMERGTIELMSATARGSVAPTALGRTGELVATFGLAALPLFALGLAGAAISLRRSAAAWRFVYVPAAVYLGAVVLLVALGIYTGSHRYLYPALPALALLAAAALGRQKPAISVVAVAASAALTVGFYPVFAGFANADAGLVAAGHAAAATPGLLVTDSPVVAYYSARKPAEVTGSGALPADPAAALAWMRAHDVHALVLENVSYYHSTALFPELASGKPTLPFAALGDESRYNAAGGKQVYAYRLLPSLSLEPVALGKTAPLAKGVTMGASATGEGMGFGVPIVRYPDGWVYARTATTTVLSSTEWVRTYDLDEMGGDNAHAYAFVPVAPRGQVEVTYRMDATGLTITVRPLWLAPGYTQAGILNEQSAAFDDLAAAGGPTLVGAGFGSWVPVAGDWARLRSGPLGVEWSLPAVAGAQLFAGREHAPPDFDWAGLDYMFPAPFAGATYRITVQEAR